MSKSRSHRSSCGIPRSVSATMYDDNGLPKRLTNAERFGVGGRLGLIPPSRAHSRVDVRSKKAPRLADWGMR